MAYYNSTKTIVIAEYIFLVSATLSIIWVVCLHQQQAFFKIYFALILLVEGFLHPHWIVVPGLTYLVCNMIAVIVCNYHQAALFSIVFWGVIKFFDWSLLSSTFSFFTHGLNILLILYPMVAVARYRDYFLLPGLVIIIWLGILMSRNFGYLPLLDESEGTFIALSLCCISFLIQRTTWLRFRYNEFKIEKSQNEENFLRTIAFLEKGCKERYHAEARLIKANKELTENQQALMQAERMATIGHLCSIILTKMNEPIITLRESIGQLQLIQHSLASEDIDTAEKTPPMVVQQNRLLKEQIDLMLKDIHVLSQFCKDLSLLTQQSQDDFRIIPFKDLLLPIIELLKNQFPKDIHLQINLHGSKSVRVKPRQLSQAILNVLLNSFQSLVASTAKSKRISMSFETIEDKIALIIRDSGGGIEPHLAQKIFDPFFTTKADRGCSGLGLSVALQIVRQHKGSILYESSSFHETIFKIILPAEKL